MLAVALAWGIGWLQAREEYKREQAPNSYAAAAKQDAQSACVGTDPVAVFECVNEKAKTAYQAAHDEQDLSAQQRAASSALASAALSFLALALSGVGVWYVKRTLDATLDAVEDTGEATRAMMRQNEITEAAQRAWVVIEKLTVDRFYISPDKSVTAKIDFKIKNIGLSPAKIINVPVVEGNWEYRIDFHAIREKIASGNICPFDHLAPGQSREDFILIVDEDRLLLKNGNSFCIYISAFYLSGDDKSLHETYQVWTVAKQIFGRFSCQGWNDDEIEAGTVTKAEIGLTSTIALT